MRTAIATTISGDTALAALLTGGVFTATEITRQITPTAFDAATRELKPCCLVRINTITPPGGLPTTARAARASVIIELRQRLGYDVIEPARRRIYALLNLVRLAPSDEASGAWQIQFVDEVLDLEDPVLDAALILCRYMAYYRRS